MRNMQNPISSDERLKILQTVDTHRRWYSLDDKRLCAICDRVIDGHNIEIRHVAGCYTIHCPTADCPSNFSHWFFYHQRGLGGAGSKRRREQPTDMPAPVVSSIGEMSFLFEADR